MNSHSVGPSTLASIARRAQLALTAAAVCLVLARPADAFTFAGHPRAVHIGAIAPPAKQTWYGVPMAERCGVRRRNAFRPSMGVSASVIEGVAKGILNLALANPRQATVECRIRSSAMELVQGKLHEAKVDGWVWH